MLGLLTDQFALQEVEAQSAVETLNPWKGEGRGAEAAAVAAALVSLLLGYLDTALPSEADTSDSAYSSAAVMQVIHASCYSCFSACLK